MVRKKFFFNHFNFKHMQENKLAKQNNFDFFQSFFTVLSRLDLACPAMMTESKAVPSLCSTKCLYIINMFHRKNKITDMRKNRSIKPLSIYANAGILLWSLLHQNKDFNKISSNSQSSSNMATILSACH